MTKAMKIKEAKEYVASKLRIAISELTDPVVMTELREELQLGSITPVPGSAKGIEAKHRIAELLNIDINCVRRFKQKISK